MATNSYKMQIKRMEKALKTQIPQQNCNSQRQTETAEKRDLLCKVTEK